MHGIIIGVDESDGAAAALRWGFVHASRRGVPATAIMAWSSRDQHRLDPSHPCHVHYGSEDARRDLEAIVQRALGDDASAVHRRTTCEGPAAALIEASEGASLVVVGARGIGGFKGLLVGSVSREVLHRSRAPVAVVREAVLEPDGPIVVGIDGSDDSRRALAWALGEARATGRRLVALHAWHISAAGDVVPTAHLSGDALHAGADLLLERELAPADTTGVVVERRAEEQRPAAALVDASATASLIVVGSRGHRPLTGLLLGSVSDQVAHHAHCAVVVVPPSSHDAS